MAALSNTPPIVLSRQARAELKRQRRAERVKQICLNISDENPSVLAQQLRRWALAQS